MSKHCDNLVLVLALLYSSALSQSGWQQDQMNPLSQCYFVPATFQIFMKCIFSKNYSKLLGWYYNPKYSIFYFTLYIVPRILIFVHSTKQLKKKPVCY